MCLVYLLTGVFILLGFISIALRVAIVELTHYLLKLLKA